MDAREIEAVMSEGSAERTAAGREAARVAVRLTVPPDAVGSLDRLRAALEAQIPALQQSVAPIGVDVLPDSLTPIGQTLELLVPLDQLTTIDKMLSEKGIRTELQIPRRMNEP